MSSVEIMNIGYIIQGPFLLAHLTMSRRSLLSEELPDAGAAVHSLVGCSNTSTELIKRTFIHPMFYAISLCIQTFIPIRT